MHPSTTLQLRSSTSNYRVSVMILFCKSSANGLPQSLHLWFCLPLWMWPYLTVCSDVQGGQGGVSAFILHVNNPPCHYLLGTTHV
ncbi:MAG: hypothetical protein AVDCRST_MAG93-4932 [uncultured Chloroflexia bacterium]|uniref:Uncharacterized protein n=1 Tax=uncultured Chloroflexia bacterium TaxID=1672391 RepID=A0A6J4KHS3_9CHLR|nr:MAG: hypothetical protein AVDCRST_MAG93-4932 [uncultured Chloroflexia bacterium]